jgi:putative SbcD/Mre11-related phosphoesterase
VNRSYTDTGIHLFEGWQLTPEGAAIRPRARTAVIADVHLGYEWARAAAGDCVPVHSLDETLARLSCLLRRATLARLVVAGDLVESSRPCRRTVADVRRLRQWLAARGVSLLVLEGNHDRSLFERLTQSTCTVAGWTIGHGHHPLRGPKTISAHHHPVLRLQGITAPCFLVRPGRIILPAFSSNAAGYDVMRALVPPVWLDGSQRCLASTGAELLDFGSLSDLRRRRHRVS